MTRVIVIALLMRITQNSSMASAIRGMHFLKTFVTGFVPLCLCGCDVSRLPNGRRATVSAAAWTSVGSQASSLGGRVAL